MNTAATPGLDLTPSPPTGDHQTMLGDLLTAIAILGVVALCTLFLGGAQMGGPFALVMALTSTAALLAGRAVAARAARTRAVWWGVHDANIFALEEHYNVTFTDRPSMRATSPTPHAVRIGADRTPAVSTLTLTRTGEKMRAALFSAGLEHTAAVTD